MAMLAWIADERLLDGVAITVPLFGALVAALYRARPRVTGLAAATISAIACGLLVAFAPAGESLYPSLMLLFSCLSVGATLVLPHRDCTSDTMSGILFILGSTLLAYSADNLLVMLAAWTVSAAPFFLPQWRQPHRWRARASFLVSIGALALAIALMTAGADTFSIGSLIGKSPGGKAAFWLLVTAVIFRKGILPAHAWVADAAEGPAIPTALLWNGHLGAMLVAKLIVPLFPTTTVNLFPALSFLAIVTALYVSIRALTENAPRRMLAFVSLSQSAAILAGLESRTVEGITGALVHWVVVTVSTLGLFGILRLLEVRFGENLTAGRHLGLGEHAPRLAVFFVVFGLALVGLPGTLSFCSQDLLIHGTLRSHPLTGLLLPIATAMNAVSIFRLFTRLFLGKRRTGFTAVVDALPRERWVLAIAMLFVVLGGIFPNAIVARLSPAAQDNGVRPTKVRSSILKN